jgi:type II secretory pathway component GspD/PulD (secretin)
VSSSRLKSEINDGLLRKTEFEGSSSSSSGNASDNSQTATGSSGQTGEIEVSNIKKILENVLSDQGKVVEDTRTNSLIITDKPEQFPIIEKTIALLDIPTPQVVIEVEMLDVSKNLVDKLGVNWDTTSTDSQLTFSGASRETKFPFDGGYVGDSTDVVASKTFTMGTISAAGLDIALDFISTDTDTKYLARPRILTLSNETAEIKIVTDEAIGLTQSVSGEGNTALSTQEAERSETGVALRVTPQVNSETSEITMFVEPTVSEAATSNLSSSFRDPERRQTKSVLRIKDGETIVIGGLIRTRGSETITKVPFLGDIPILGNAFKHRNKSKDEDRELIIFITPHIVKEQKLTSVKNRYSPLSPFSREQELPRSKMAEVDKALSRFENKHR